MRETYIPDDRRTQMHAEERDFIVRPDAMSVLERRADTTRGNGRMPAPAAAETPPAVANGRQLGPIGFISQRELQQVVSAHFEYPALRRGINGYSPALAAAFNPYSAKGRALRYLSARIMLEAFSQQGLCFSVAGAHRGCGATYVAANLGVVFSQLGLRTLLVDANLRQPGLQTLFNERQGRGLASLIAGEASPGSCIVPLAGFRDLSLLPAGRGAGRAKANIGNGALANTLASVRSAYDVVICDSAAGGQGDEDCELVAGMCGCTVTVFRKHRTDLARARRLLAALDAVGTKQIGSVLCDY